jgi:hypothetical protein
LKNKTRFINVIYCPLLITDNTEEMKNSINYHRKEELRFYENFVHEPQAIKFRSFTKKQQNEDPKPEIEKNRFQFIVPWQLHE